MISWEKPRAPSLGASGLPDTSGWKRGSVHHGKDDG